VKRSGEAAGGDVDAQEGVECGKSEKSVEGMPPETIEASSTPAGVGVEHTWVDFHPSGGVLCMQQLHWHFE
jgi:hypothetical protein